MTDILERAARAMTGITPGEWRSVTALGASETGRYLHPESPWRVIEGPPQAIQPETLGKRFFTHAPDADFIAAAPGRAPQRVERARAPQWTASIDAALALVPDGWTRAVDATAPELGVDVQLFPPADGSEVVGSHKHETLALCIAALRARP